MKVNIVIVTYNRKELLVKCLKAILQQTYNYENIILVDNASTDGTIVFLESQKLLDHPKLILLKQAENAGGAGGFAAGMKYAFDHDSEYVWMMDDDALPHQTALEELMRYATPEHIYGSLAVNGRDTAWTTKLVVENKDVHIKSDIPDIAEVQSLPFLGYLTSKEIYQKLGLPNTSYFIAADDVEYCIRAQQAGYKIYICGKSQIEHPKSDRYVYSFLGKKIICLKLVPWKRYYDTRNRILIAKKYYGIRLYTQTLPASFVRLFATLLNEDDRLTQIKAFFFGLYDGLANKLGKRHDHWGL